jgi:4-hydroxy-tetrahydrodipicolinate synthase
MRNAGRIQLAGVIPILPTPFTSQGDLDECGFRAVIDGAIGDGVQALAMFGLASEYAKLSDAERVSLTKILIEHVAGRVPVIISITSHAIEVARKEAAAAVEAGADALMILPPFFLSPSAAAVRSHLATIAEENDVPIILQYAPAQTGSSLTPEVCFALHKEHANIAFIKVDALPSGPMISLLRSGSDDSLQSMVGYMGLHLINDLARGVAAVMPTVSVSGAFVSLMARIERDRNGARSLHEHMLPLLNFMMQSIEMLVAVEKVLLVRRGLIASAYCRSPRWTIDRQHLDELDYLCRTRSDVLKLTTPMRGAVE